MWISRGANVLRRWKLRLITSQSECHSQDYQESKENERIETRMNEGMKQKKKQNL